MRRRSILQSLGLLPGLLLAAPPAHARSRAQQDASGQVVAWRGDSQRSGVMHGPLPESMDVLVLRWRADLGTAPYADAVISDWTVYLGTGTGELLALNQGTGEERWSKSLSGTVNTPAMSGASLYVTTSDPDRAGRLFAIGRASSNVEWESSFTPISVSPVVEQHNLFVVTGDGDLVSLDAAMGDERWRYPIGTPARWAPASSAGMIYIRNADGQLFAIDAQKGALRWMENLPPGDDGTPVISGKTLIAVTQDPACGSDCPSGDHLVALDVERGTEQWSAELGAVVTGAPAVADGNAILMTRQEARMSVLAYSLESGAKLWESPVADAMANLAFADVSGPVLVEGKVLAPVPGVGIVVLDAATGEEVPTVLDLGPNGTVSIVVADELIFTRVVQGGLHTLQVFGERP